MAMSPPCAKRPVTCWMVARRPSKAMRPLAPETPKPVSPSAMVASTRSMVPLVAGAARVPLMARSTRALPARRSSRSERSARSASGAVPLARRLSPGPLNGTCPLTVSDRPAPESVAATLDAVLVALPLAFNASAGRPASRVAATRKPVQSTCQSKAGEAGCPVTVARPLSDPSAPRPGEKPLATDAATLVTTMVRSSCGATAPSTRTDPPPNARVAPDDLRLRTVEIDRHRLVERDRKLERRSAQRVDGDGRVGESARRRTDRRRAPWRWPRTLSHRPRRWLSPWPCRGGRRRPSWPRPMRCREFAACRRRRRW